MPLQIRDTVPNLEAHTTAGTLRYHKSTADPWAVPSSQPSDFTPLCTTDFGHSTNITPELDHRDAKIIRLSVDPPNNHATSASNNKQTQRHPPNHP